MEKTKKPPPCRIYDMQTSTWRDFKILKISIDKTKEEIFYLENQDTQSNITITKVVNFEYIAYYSKYLPQALREYQVENTRSSSVNKSFSSQGGKQKGFNWDKDVRSMIVFEDLTLRYEDEVREDQYIVLGFNPRYIFYDEKNYELKYIRDRIGEFHYKLKYSEYAIRYQVSQRFQNILYKTLKYSLCYIAELCNIDPDLCAETKLKTLQKMYYDPAFQEFVGSIIGDKQFKQELLSIVYKTILAAGIFPAHVELNTMNEWSYWVKFKNFVTSVVSAPYGSKHHASFSLGNFRYSFVYESNNKDRQKVSISSDLKRGFSLKNQSYKYFRLKFFDFFPMDHWIYDIADEAERLLNLYLTEADKEVVEILENDGSMKDVLWNFTERCCALKDIEIIHERIAKDFFGRYNKELSEPHNDRVFRKFTQLIADADIRGYSNLSNNCQTIVTEIVSLFSRNFQRYVEPLCDVSKIPHLYNSSNEHLLKEFLKFGSKFNFNYDYIGPFSLSFRLSYFDTFTDKDTSELLSPKKLEEIQDQIKKYFKREDVSEFMTQIEDALLCYSRIHIVKKENSQEKEREGNSEEEESKSQKPKQKIEEDVKYPDIKFHSDALFSIVSCLLSLKYNQLFNLKRDIKICRRCQERLEEEDIDIVENPPKGRKQQIDQWKSKVAELPGLYKKKYECLAVYKEICFYYYNTIRLAVKTKLSDSTSYLGFLLTRKPEIVHKGPTSAYGFLNSTLDKTDFTSSNVQQTTLTLLD